jgi:hypothetical protein
VRDRVDAFDSFVERAVLRDVLNDDELKALAIFRELFFEKCAPGQRADGAAHGVPGFEIFLYDPNSEIAIRTSDEDFSGGRNGNHLEERGVACEAGDSGAGTVYVCSFPGALGVGETPCRDTMQRCCQLLRSIAS